MHLSQSTLRRLHDAITRIEYPIQLESRRNPFESDASAIDSLALHATQKLIFIIYM